MTYHSWFACYILDRQADSRNRLRNGGAPLIPPHYLQLDLPKHVMRNVSRLCLCAHPLAAESSIWCGGKASGHCDKCSCAAIQNEVHVLFHCRKWFVLSQKEVLVPFFPSCQFFSVEAASRRPLIIVYALASQTVFSV